MLRYMPPRGIRGEMVEAYACWHYRRAFGVRADDVD